MRDMTDAEKENAAFEDGVEFEKKRTKLLLQFVTLFTTWGHNDKDEGGQEGELCTPCQAADIIKQYEEFKNG